MTEFIFHIGLPKTGTTTLQKQVFSNLPYYVGKHHADHAEPDLSKAALNAVAHGRTHEAIDFIAGAVQKHSSEKMLLSEEIFAQMNARDHSRRWPISKRQNLASLRNADELPVISMIRQLSQHSELAQGFKILITLRNQPDWLASIYAQESSYNRKAGQADFEEKVNQLLESSNPYLDWSRLVKNTENLVGRENVCTLLIENMNSSEYWQQLAGFIGLDNPAYPQWGGTRESRERVLKLSEDHWEIKAYAPPKLKRVIKKWSTKMQNVSKPPRSVRKASSLFGPHWDQVATLTYGKWVNYGRGREFHLHPELRLRILEHCRPFNKRLSEQLERDLRPLGY